MGLNITRNEYEALLNIFARISKDDELEAVIKGRDPATRTPKITYYRFQSLLNYLASRGYNRTSHDINLDISFSNIHNTNTRITIKGNDNISRYCSTGVSDIHEVISKKPQHNIPRLYLSEHDVKFKTSIEEKVLDTRNILNHISKLPKTFRLKKRISFTIKNFRVDCTIVKSHENQLDMLSMVDMSKVSPNYEIEIEYIGKKDKSDLEENKGVYAKEFLAVASEILKVLDDTDYLISNSKRLAILKEYHNLVTGQELLNIQELEQSPRKFFVGPQPITMELRHLVSPNESSDSIYKSYTVTHKSDGERYLAFIDSSGSLYLINNRIEVRPTKIQADSLKSSLFDCELITLKDKKLIQIFDTYINKGDKSVMTLPLETKDKDTVCRMNYARNLKKALNNTQPKFEIEAKEFKIIDSVTELRQACQELFNTQDTKKLPYKTDGLIFTPLDLPVGGNKRDDTPTLGNTWTKVLKWKPIEDNSIDFLVRFKQFHQYGPNFKVLELFVGKDVAARTPWEYWSQTAQLRKAYMPVLFQPPNAPSDVHECKLIVDENKNVCCINNDVINDDTIVEMSWDIDHWVPLRVRQDKTDLYRRDKKISRTANDYDVAVDTWNTIQIPITREMLLSPSPLSRSEIPQNMDIYYANKSRARRDNETFKMAQFHNAFVKNFHLIKRFTGKTSLMDIGCGKGGDIGKWIGAGFRRVYGIDRFEDNITNIKNGAYDRLNKEYRNMTQDQTYFFMPFDARIVINQDSINKLDTVPHRDIAKVAYGYSPRPRDRRLQKIYKIASDPFDIVSVQFAIHYFFENDSTLENFCQNVSRHLKEGGYFIGTCFDAERVNRLFIDGSVEKNMHKNGNLIWSIRKKYESYSPMTTGQTINVFFESINQYIDEYLVDYNLLVHALAKYNIRPLTPTECSEIGIPEDIKSSGTFDRLFDYMKSMNNIFVGQERSWYDNAISMSLEEKEFSFLNRWFIFRKA